MNAVYRTQDWPRDADRMADRLVAELPPNLGLDFSPSSLPRLEAELLRRFSDPAELTAPEARTFYEGFSAYFGIVILRNGGGWRWGWSTTWDDTDPPRVMPDEELDLEPLSPWEAVVRAVECREGDVFHTIWASWDTAAVDYINESFAAARLAAAQAELEADLAEFDES